MINKILLILFNTLLIVQLHAQCEECNSFEEALKDPKKVTSLKINSNVNRMNLNEIPVEIGQLVNLKVLYLSDLDIATIPAEIGNLSKVRVISFAGCKLSSLPDEIYTLKKLREIILLTNEFSEKEIALIRARFKKELPKARVLID